MQIITENAYMCLPENVYVLKDAYKGYVLGISTDDNTTKEFKINKDALKIISLMTGRQTLSEIVNSLKIDTNSSKVMNKIINFLKEINSISTIHISNIPIEFPSPIIGDLNNNFPRHFAIELTNKCNIKCRFCYNDSTCNNNSFLKDPIEVLKGLKSSKVQAIELTGGEPFLHPKFLEIVNYSLNNFSIVAVITNGTHLSDEFFKLVDGKNIFIQVTLPGSSKESAIGEYIDTSEEQSMDIYKKKIEFIKKIAEHKISSRIVMVVDDAKKLDDIENTIILAKELGVNSFTFTLSIPSGRSLDSAEKMSNQNIKKYFDLNQILMNKYYGFVDNEVDYNDIPDLNKGWNCGAGHRTNAITSNNKIKPCVMFMDSNSYDDLNTDDVVKSIRNRKHVDAYSSIVVPNFSTCKECTHANYCLGCLARGIAKLKEIGECNCLWFKQLGSNEKKMISNIFIKE